jgi:RNA polymerase sigma-70 factor (ECF subfamily)
MGYLRSVRLRPASADAASSCVDAFDRELDYLFVTLQRLGARPPEMEDLLQDIFLVLHRHWPTLDSTRSLRPWLFGVTFRVLRASRRRYRREVVSGEVEIEDAAPGPEAWVQDRESLALLSAALDRVPLARRSVLLLHDLEGIEIADIARRLSMSKIGVYTRLYKGRKELAVALRRLRRAEA